MSGGADRPSPLDGPAARLAAVAVALAGLALLGWINRGALFGPDPAAAPANPAEAAFRACVAPRAAQFAAALERGELTEEQAALFRRRAEALCADQVKKGRIAPTPGQ
ncbi:MAG: hypothetical protein OEN55_11500 [Alphaproteobacteria bacterium]|nr:hypothetical protein [Alphaproteobacteria bacterium]